MGMTPIVLQIQHFRVRKGWSQSELARRSGVSQATISRLEAGKLNALDFRKLERLAEVLGTTAGALFHAPKARQTERRSVNRAGSGRGSRKARRQ